MLYVGLNLSTISSCIESMKSQIQRWEDEDPKVYDKMKKGDLGNPYSDPFMGLVKKSRE